MESIKIHPDDDMFHGSFEHYNTVGRQMADFAVEANKIIKEGSPSLLELPCGYGRVTRKLLENFDASQLHVADIMPSAVKFCVEYFGVTGYQINQPTNQFVTIPDSRFDIAIMGSLITHLSEINAGEVINYFFKKVKIGGIGIITTHGEKSRELLGLGEVYEVGGVGRDHLLTSYDEGKFGHVEYLNDHKLEAKTVQEIGSNYGISLIPAKWIEDICYKNQLMILKFIPGGWDNHQDVFFIKK